jgi:HEPN domain-containing protein
LHKIDFPRTHDVDYLLMECQKIDNKSFVIDLRSLNELGVSVRYPDDSYIPTVEETKDYFNIAIAVRDIVERLIDLPE